MFSIKTIRRPLCYAFPVVFLMLTLFPTSGFSKMVGPYTGQVLDGRTEKPIKGASLFAYLTRYRLVIGPYGGGYYPELIKSMLSYTDNKGKFTIPITLFSRGLPEFSRGLPDYYESTTIIVYQPGYQAYIYKKNNLDINSNSFKKKNSIIMLDRIPPNFDHKKHYESITSALGEMGEIHIIPPIDYLASPKGDTRMEWDKFVNKALLSAPKEEFLRRVEWENRRQ